MFAGAVSWSGASALNSAVSDVAVERVAMQEAAAGHVLRGDAGFVMSCEHLGAGPPRTGLSFHRCPQTGALVAFWGRLHDREGLTSRFGGQTDRSPAAWAWEAWRRLGPAAPAALAGEFAFVVVEPQARRVFLARDAFGTRPLYLRFDGEAVMFASHLEALRRLGRRPASSDAQWMALYLAGVPRAPDASPLVGVRKVSPGHGLLLDDALAPRSGRWIEWHDDAPWADRRESRWVDAFRDVLMDAVRVRLGEARPVAIESSGGFDSAAIVGAAARLLPDPSAQVLCLGHALAEREGGYILDMSRLHGIGSTWLDTAWRAVRSDAWIDATLRATGQPEEAATTTQFAEFPPQCVRHGAQVLLSGFGGDEAASQWGSAARHEARDRRAWRALFDVTAGRGPMRGARFVRDVLRNTDEALPVPQLDLASQVLLSEDLKQSLGIREALASQYDRLRARRSNEAVLKMLEGPFLAQRLEDSSLLAASHGVEMAWPLLDVRLVQQVLSTPAIERFGPRAVPRYLHRRAMAPFVAPTILAQRNKDMGYAAMMARLRQGDPLRQFVEAGRALDAQLHPAAAELVDRARLRAGLAAAEAGTLDGHVLTVFRRQVLKLRWLDRWLRLQAMPA